MFDSIRNLFGGKKKDSAPPLPKAPAPPRFEEEEKEIIVPEVTPAEILASAQAGSAPLILDVREAYEFKQTRVKAGAGFQVLHIPMNSVPQRIAELPKDAPIAVICASGGRSYGVAHYLLEQGYDAVNVDGGMGAWMRSGGAYEQG